MSCVFSGSLPYFYFTLFIISVLASSSGMVNYYDDDD